MDVERSHPAGTPTTVRWTVAETPPPSPATPSRRGRPKRPPRAEAVPDLSPAAAALLACRGGRDRPSPRGGESRADEPGAARLLRAAGRVSRQELLARPRCRPCLVAEIDAWLAAHGRRFRPDPPPIADALARALDHIAEMLDGSDGDAFFSAYVALPELRRSLAARKAGRPGTR